MKISYPLQGENFRLSHPLGAFGIRKGTPHKGVDLYANNGTPVLSIMDGVVEEANNRDKRGWGNQVTIKHEVDGQKYYSRYAHLSRIDVSPGERVKQGDRIGLSGGVKGAPGSGNSDGPHLHFELMDKSKSQIDPENFLKNGAILGGAAALSLTGDDDNTESKPKFTDELGKDKVELTGIDKAVAGFAKGLSPIATAISLGSLKEEIDRFKTLIK
jgi:hypothetical protein